MRYLIACPVDMVDAFNAMMRVLGHPSFAFPNDAEPRQGAGGAYVHVCSFVGPAMLRDAMLAEDLPCDGTECDAARYAHARVVEGAAAADGVIALHVAQDWEVPPIERLGLLAGNEE